ncbi:MAG: condensation domain-containing protein (plasmid) [Leptolyngbya sp. BL-A-14]
MKSSDKLLSELRQLGVRLWLDNNRLRYRAPEGAMSPDVIAELKARKEEIVAFLQQVGTTVALELPPLVPVKRQEFIPLSFAQKRFWLLHQFEPDSSANNMPVVLRLTGKLNIPVWEQSINEVVRRHEILRTTYPVMDGEPYQKIAPEVKLSLPTIDLRQVPAEQRDVEALRLTTQIAQMPFDLGEGPMLHIGLFHLQDDEYLFLWCLHCITGDGSSSDIFFQELTTIYAAFSGGQPSPLPECPVQYADFAQWQRAWLQGELLQSQLEYWKKQLSGNLAAIQLPTDRPRPPVQTYRGDRCPRMFSLDLHSKLLNLSQRCGSTLFMTLLAAFETLLYRYSNQEEILISFTNAGRNQVETEKLIGFFSGTLLLRTNFANNPTFRELMAQVKDGALEAYAHQDLPFEKLVEELRPEQSQSRSPLFQIKFALNPPWTNGRGMEAVRLPDLTIDSMFGYIYHGQTKFDLILVMREQVQGLGAVFDYNADLFDASTAARMMDHFQMLLEGIVANPDQRVLDLPLLTPTEQQQLKEWNKTQSETFPDVCIHQLFEAQAAQTPDHIAIASSDRQLTYCELNQQANQLAHYLQTLGVQPGMMVGIYLPRLPETVIALLGILKAGGTYIPLDPNSPLSIRHSLETCPVEIILTQTSLPKKLNEYAGKTINLDIEQTSIQKHAPLNPQVNSNPHQPAIILGAVNSPKVQISHHEIISRVKGIDYATLDPEETVLHHAAPDSAIAIFEIWGSLLNGSQMVIAPSQIPTLETIGDLIDQHRITTVWLPTRLFHKIVDTQLETLKSVRQLLIGGDVLSVSQVQTVLDTLPNCKLTHTYSTPNTPGFTCFYPIAETPAIDTAIPIGRPTANTQVLILNPQHQPVPIGVPGELYVSAKELAPTVQPSSTGLLNPHLFSDPPKAQLRKTGDLARYLPNGNIEWIGRSDDLVKIGGWRIEFGRIETLLSQHLAVQESVVIASKDLPEENGLVAYIVLKRDRTASMSDLRSHLRQKLPTLMIPSAFVFLDTIPLTPNGNVDRTLLPMPNLTQDQPQSFTASRDELETQLVQIWEQLFSLSAIGINDNFFDLGGDSLMAVRLFSKIEETCSKKLPLSVLLSAPTIAQMANLLRGESIADAWNPLVLIQAGNSFKPPLFCIHGGGFNVLIYRQLAMNLNPDQPVYGLQARGLDGGITKVGDRIEDLAADYVQQIMTVQPQGPYFLAGLSNGGIIALEMAQQLLARGEETAFLAMFDTYGPDGAYLLPSLPRFGSSLWYMLRYSLPRLINTSRLKKEIFAITQMPNKAKVQFSKLNTHESGSKSKQTNVSENHTDIDKSVVGNNKLEHWVNQFSQYVLEHSPWSFFTPKEVLGDVVGSTSETLKQLEERHRTTYKTYAPRPYSGHIVLFRATETPPGYHTDFYLGWDKVAMNGVKVFKIPGHHTSLMSSTLLAKKVEQCLANIQRLKQNH